MMKTKKLLKIYSGLLLIAVATMCMLLRIKDQHTHSLPTRDYAEIASEGKLHILTNFDPIGYTLSGDTLQGFQYELSQALSTLSGLEILIETEPNLDESFRKLNEQTCDIIARCITITPEKKEAYLFTEPILLDKQVLIQRTSKANQGIKPIRRQLELGGKTLYLPASSPAHLRLHHLMHEIGDTIYIVEEKESTIDSLAARVARGEIDFAVGESRPLQLIGQDLPEIDCKTEISFTQLQSWAVRKDSPILLDSLNSWFSQIRKNGTFNKIYHKYYK